MIIRLLFAFEMALTISQTVAAGDPADSIVRLSVQPMPAPRPALQYRLFPDPAELNAGNGAQWYLRCFAEQRYFFFTKDGRALRAELLTLPLAEIRAKNHKEYGGNALRQADWAARLDSIDWQMQPRIQTEGIDLTQPELEPLLLLAESLRARHRVELAWHRSDDAIRTVQTLMAMARHLGENPTEKANRLGLAVAGLALDSIEEMIQQPGCPNLYWALTDLPVTVVDVRKGLQTKAVVVSAELKAIHEDRVMTADEVEKVVSRLSGAIGVAREEAGRPPRSFRSATTARTKNPAELRATRERLIKDGVAEGLVPSFLPLQAVLIEEKRRYETDRDDRLKLISLPPSQIDGGTSKSTGGDGLLADLLPPVIVVRGIQARIEQRIGLLRHIEALRLYAAEHDGRLPSKLADLSVPLPPDIVTGRPFVYDASGSSARLKGSPTRAEGRSMVYEIAVVGKR